MAINVTRDTNKPQYVTIGLTPGEYRQVVSAAGSVAAAEKLCGNKIHIIELKPLPTLEDETASVMRIKRRHCVACGGQGYDRRSGKPCRKC